MVTSLAADWQRYVPATVALHLGSAIDLLLLRLFKGPAAIPDAAEQDRMFAEVARAREAWRERGVLGDPLAFHRAPPPAEPIVERAGAWGIRHERLLYASGYEPEPGDPARERWLGYEENRTAVAAVLRHRNPDAPWLVCLHGLGMGNPFVDFQGFRAASLHSLGMSLVFPVQPLHGRRASRAKGLSAYMSFDLLEVVHGMAQAVWDLRRLLGWLRAQGVTRIGLYGLSLGAYTAALLATLDDFDLLLAGIPFCAIPELFVSHAPASLRAKIEKRGLLGADMEEALRVISPLWRQPRVAPERRWLFAGSGDRLIPALQAERLHQHWQGPPIKWYPGGHVSFFWTHQIQRFVERSLVAAGYATAVAV